MRNVLGDLESLLIRAKWTNTANETKSYLSVIKMYYSKEYRNTSTIPGNARPSNSVEKCACPPQFTGDSCQYCAPGYTREEPHNGPTTPCVPCSCHGNSEECDRDSGVCFNCRYNTSGIHCENCANGYYGNASLGSPEACKSCSCFGGHESCHVIANGSFECTCSTGYKGRQCELCSFGYWGTPTELNGRCSKCDCNDNSVTCDITSGNCSSHCHNDTTGFNCEWCEPGFWGNANEKTCKKCSCAELGSKHEICDNRTGQCSCKTNVKGQSCSSCKDNYWGYDSGIGCTFCNCSQYGAISQQCNLTTGICSCQGNATGIMCDQCPPGLYDVSKECIDCNCNMTYSQDNICNNYTGQCKCKKSSEGGNYGGQQCTQCAWDAVGTFPSCAQCNETCYANWYELINDERNKVSLLNQNVTELWKTFNESTADEISQTLVELSKKLNDSENVFRGAQKSTGEKEKQFKQINESMANLVKDLDQAKNTLTNISFYLNNIAAPFDGSVNITSQRPSVSANHSTIRSWADQILNEVNLLNHSAYQDYENIVSDYEEIKRYNENGSKIIMQIEMAMDQLKKVQNITNEIKALLNEEFYKNVEDNNKKLAELKRDSEDIDRLVNDSSEISSKATERLKYAKDNLTEADNIATKILEESGVVYNSSLRAEKNANEALNKSTDFLNNSTAVLRTVNDAIDDVTEAISDMARAKVNVDNATTISESVLAISIPVDIQTINDLSSEILKIPVNETLVNATLKDANDRVKIANEAQIRSEQAKNISEEVLFEIKEVERKIKLAENYRKNTTTLRNITDNMVKDIEQTSSKIQRDFSEASRIGNETLDLLDTNIKDIDKNFKCFNESLLVAKNASNVAELAYTMISDASKIINESTTTLNKVEPQLRHSHQIAVKDYDDIVETNKNATKLFEDIKEAEDLLNNLISQRDEMNALEKEIVDLERILDDVNTELDTKLTDYESCGNN